ncbi:ADP-ribosylglycohydrolase [Anseongella ginsenosidimutans]|uniref:ADP-ribosylglycohydrolase n=1 Tax=Anseongella ginsenosidimutans TaxID=496056 RepID=A0A4R3L0R0_9SPHI|nr:ADP-ribosylglycohydrolase family protein [Anseongella ginsenosidimutans]QEC51324.1 ADP-ribosylglycohydrolase family protein [Anseongella ginsenosidimutans]TCS89982.1 ADP-ribosylglycohydrolase [Anseongella ginsenosidimutans]
MILNITERSGLIAVSALLFLVTAGAVPAAAPAAAPAQAVIPPALPAAVAPATAPPAPPAAPAPGNTIIQVPVETITDKIRGGLLGQMLGNLNGLPHEFKYYDEPGNVQDYTPSLPEGARTDDDTDFEWVYIIEMQKSRNVFLSPEAIASLWKEKINDRIWCSNRYARYLMDLGIQPPLTGKMVLNPWGEFNISGQFLSETFGLIVPAMPQTAAKIGLNYTTAAISGEPAQTTQLFTAMIATAFIEEDINKVLEAGIAALDTGSVIADIIGDIRRWHAQNPKDWKETRRRLREKYSVEGGNTRDSNGSELNTGAIITALLYGKGDFAESLKLAFNLGWDADCNAATLGTILGVTTGYRNMLTGNGSGGWLIVDRYRNTTRDNMPVNETITSFADRLIELFELVNQEQGGRKTVKNNILVYEIPAEKPAPVIHLASPRRQQELLSDAQEKKILSDLLKQDRDAKARAAYMAISLGMNDSLSKKHPRQWKEATFALSGYWKVMDNIFHGGDFKGLDRLKAKFLAAGFKTPPKKYSDSELYDDPEIWKDPKNLY